jgi:malonyl CoA-acyl carrier protein transacylase
VIVVVCPGQGSQTPGFLTPWLEDPAFAAELHDISDAVGLDLVAHGTLSDADTIRDTAVAQPLIVAAGLLTLKSLLANGRRERIAGIAGHSSVRSLRPLAPASSARPTPYGSCESAAPPWPAQQHSNRPG